MMDTNTLNKLESNVVCKDFLYTTQRGGQVFHFGKPGQQQATHPFSLAPLRKGRSPNHQPKEQTS